MILFGKQPVMYALQYHNDLIEEILLAKTLPKEQFSALKKFGKPICVVDSKKAQALSHGRNHQGILARAKELELSPLNALKNHAHLLALCGVSDVGNIGAMVRSGYGLGVEGVIIGDCHLAKSAIEGIVRTSAGAALDMPLCVIARTIEVLNELKIAGFTLIGADKNGENLNTLLQNHQKTQQNHTQSVQIPQKSDKITALQSLDSGISDSHKTPKPTQSLQKWVLFMGSENEGLHPKILKKMDMVLSIPMQREFNSLNVAHAAVIILDRLLNRG
ncbi:23S rRNA (guanosine(2251)-2'-O)-methyltransferase RlmB [Helicobacter sp. MIT 00-7814]|uniref:TrmH family RNA methyltransferase n=1 Tax=unclassified Helicobacter TaxID=2593540 RepID=UPI000E1F0F20|nr:MULTISPECIES: RNA methyltransferase [unclassified Helicobacter]RDU56357.1 23S rRNA (guanosine(2251)-2'-O)-methyltransferase RlmB [Helicobacter sp. MIT 99-10781]RDU56440.1 23S rRNA (guanosine(2251)-2'-O)-methyltransferase RlmB [Helicobacter sp. MIT 00-7814]